MINMTSRSQVERFIRGAEFHTGRILGLDPSEGPARAYRAQLSQHRQDYPLTFVYQDNSWNFFSDRSWNWISMPSSASAESSKKKTKKEEEQESAGRALCVGIIGTLFFAWHATKSIRSMTEWAETVALANSARITAFNLTQDQDVQASRKHQQLFLDLTDLVKTYLTVIEAEYSKVRNYAIASSVALAGSLALVAGGYFVASGLITAGYVSLVAAAVLALANCGWHWDDTKVKQACYVLIGCQESQDKIVQGLFDKVKTQLEQMGEVLTPPPAYQHDAPIPDYVPVQQYVPVEDANYYKPLYPVLPPYNSAYAPSAPPL